MNLYPAKNLTEVTQHLQGVSSLPKFCREKSNQSPNKSQGENKVNGNIPQLQDIRGQSLAKKALLIAAAGGHNLLFIGPPGAGKTLLARTLPGLLPSLTEEESLETTRIHHCSGNIKFRNQMILDPPFRAPHHSITDAGLMGGGKYLLPGELSLAHNGVLFLDELPEFKRHVLEILREPLESGSIHLSRALGFVRYPARLQLIAAMNPCPCGYWGVNEGICHCSPAMIRNYSKRISGPLLDRIDIRLFLHPVACSEFLEEISAKDKLETLTSLQARTLVQKIRKKQARRFEGENFDRNALISSEKLKKYCPLSEESKKALAEGLKNPFASGRSIHRLLRLARTLEDLNEEGGEKKGQDFLSVRAIKEALSCWQMPDLWSF
jgi:magnesium chelatase family protein